MAITEIQIADFAKACTEMRAGHATDPVLTYTIGRKYARIMASNGGDSRSAWAFVDMTTGSIFKPASWATPAKHARGNIANGSTGMGPYGPAYLR